MRILTDFSNIDRSYLSDEEKNYIKGNLVNVVTKYFAERIKVNQRKDIIRVTSDICKTSLTSNF